MQKEKQLRPLKLLEAIFLFGFSALIFWTSIYYLMPKMLDSGISVFWTFTVGFLLPLIILLAATLFSYKNEGNALNWKGFKARLRIKKMTKRDWLWTGFLLFVTLFGYFGLKFTADWLMTVPFFEPPQYLELFRTEDTFLGFTLSGTWWLALYHFILLIFNIFGEEVWFRGIIFPRQEKAHGKYAWIVHGLLYNAFHFFWKWDVIRLLPESLAYGLVAQKTKNTTPCIVSHFAFNGIGLLITIIAIAG